MRGEIRMKIAFSWDDGAPEDLTLFEIHEKYGIPGIFFVPTKNREGRGVLTETDIEQAKSQFITFGGHTENHIYLTECHSLTEVEDEIVKNKVFLENCTGKEIKHFCLPGGKYNEDILKIAQKYYTTIRTAHTMNFKPGSNNRIIKPTFHFYPRGIKSLVGNSIRNNNGKYAIFSMKHRKKSYFDIMRRIIEKERERESLIMIWGHSWEIEKLHLWDELISFFQFVKSNYSDEICDYSEFTNML